MTDEEDIQYGRDRTVGFREGWRDGLALAQENLAEHQRARIEAWLHAQGWRKVELEEQAAPRIRQGIEEMDQARRERIGWACIGGFVVAVILGLVVSDLVLKGYGR